MTRQLRLPPGLEEEWSAETAWLAGLPRLAAELAADWGLRLEQPFATPRSLVVPAGDVVLKLNAPGHFEADHEADALAAWKGRGAVRLLARDEERRALLVERCRPGTELAGSGADEEAVVADLLPRLAVTPSEPYPFRRLVDEADRWAEEVPARFASGGRPFERSLLSFAVDVFTSADRSAGSLVNQDLHGWNILRATREPWLVIDPKPLVGEAELSGVGLLRNAAFRGGVPEARRWLDVLASCSLDRERAQAWGVAHALAWGWTEREGWSRRSIEAARAIRAA
ncbi:MAG TPA: aminoglycoside phosphotransferase family protein [Gaiella sp.]|nr:aminoglycoside phosphotransferase family protein [Gaiella sp.]